MIKTCKRILTEYWSMFFVAAFVICTILYLAVRKDNIYVAGPDLLDSNIMWNKVRRDVLIAGTSDYAHVPFLKGDATLDRLLKFSLSPIGLIYELLPAFHAYVFCFYARLVIAVVGWYFMAKNILPKGQVTKNLNIIIFCGFLYGILPIWPAGSGALGFAILPWILTDFALIYRTGKLRYCFCVIIFPFFVGLALFGMFICGYLLFFIICDAIRKKKINVKLLSSLILLCASYLLRERATITQVVTGSTIYDHMKRGESWTLEELIDSFIYIFKNGHYHSGDCHWYIILPVCIIGILIVNFVHIRNKDSLSDIILDTPNLLMFWIIFNVLVYVLWDSEGVVDIICSFIPLLKGLNLTRTLWFNPFAWYLCFFVLMIRLKEYCFPHLANVLCLCAFSAICLMGASYTSSIFYNDISTNLEYALHEVITGEKPDSLTWREFYSETLFEDIKKEIDYKGEWAVAFGFHPAILNYNEINTLDGYYSGYSREYKEQFAELIGPYLKTDSDRVDYFYDYGGRAYVFCDEADYDIGRYLEIKPCDMLIDSDVFCKMGGKYVFSRIPIANSGELGFRFLKCFMGEESPYEIYVYCTDTK